MDRIVAASAQAWPLHDAAASRRIEAAALAAAEPHALMRRAGAAVARLAVAVAPHARRVWVAAGPGNNGGDGLEAAIHLLRAGREVRVTLLAGAHPPGDAADALQRARDAGVPIDSALPDAVQADLAIDAVLGLGTRRAPEGAFADAVQRLNAASTPVLAVDLPTGLHPDTGQPLGADAVQARHTLALLTLKPGYFTGAGRDHAGSVWLDRLGSAIDSPPTAWLAGTPHVPARRHAQHKGSFGDVVVVGGAAGMAGAALLTARAALATGAGRVYAALLDPAGGPLDASAPELMLRRLDWALAPTTLAGATVVCGCGGGSAVREALPAVLHHAARLVLDADALNAIAADTALAALLRARRRPALLTPHPLEAARLLGSDAKAVQSDRLAAAQALAQRFGTAVLLKGSGTVVAAPDELPTINPTGSARLASAGSGDVLAGVIGALWAQSPGACAQAVAAEAAWRHGRAADMAPGDAAVLTATRLIGALASPVPSS